MNLVTLDNVSLEFGHLPLLKDASFTIQPGERVCLIGRNGTGKSSLMKLITGVYHPDNGSIQYKQNLRISQLDQSLPESSEQTVYEVITTGLEELRGYIQDFEDLSQKQFADAAEETAAYKQMERLQQKIDSNGGWNINQQVETIISQLNLPRDKKLKDLSGGWRRRVSLGKALVTNPELLLLDEPTNHLDMTAIEWLEGRVKSYNGAVLFVTHDRAFLQKIATRIVEIDRGKLISWPGNYKNYLMLKEKSLEEEDKNNAEFDKKLAQEEVWIRQGVKARRTRNEGRVRALEKLRAERAKRINRTGKAKVQISEGEKSARKVIEAKNVYQHFNGNYIINGLSLRIMRGDRIGLVGNNGVGKSTLLKTLLGQIEAESGTIKIGEGVDIAYFDQTHHELEMEKSLAHNVADGKDYIYINGNERHIIGYLKNFLFAPERSMTPVKALSGGERNRAVLAKLFAQPSNLLILDEPTNDLDMEMLEVLEERLMEYQGTLIIVSHDRDFLDNVVTSIVVFEDDNKIEEYLGGYSDWLKFNKSLAVNDTPEEIAKKAALELSNPTTEPSQNNGNGNGNNNGKAEVKPKKLSYKFQRELEMLPNEIATLEAELEVLHNASTSADFYQQDSQTVETALKVLGDKQQSLDKMVERWAELEEMAS